MRKKDLFLLSFVAQTCLLGSQTITFNDVSTKRDILYFPPIVTYSNIAFTTDSFDVVDNKAKFELFDNNDKIVCFLFKNKECDIYIKEGDELQIDYDQSASRLVISGDNGQCHTSYNEIFRFYMRYHYELFADQDPSWFFSATNEAEYEMKLEEFVANELLLMKDELQRGGCNNKLLEVYYTNLFCSFIYSLAESMLPEENNKKIIQSIIQRTQIDSNVIKIVPNNFMYYEVKYNLDALMAEPRPSFIERFEYARHLPQDIGSYIIEVSLLLDYRMIGDIQRTCDFYQVIKNWTDFVYFKDAIHLFDKCD
ncbi:MAG: hypothetical protein R2795_25240 [Saprospiraceae bacterium]